MAKFTYHKGCVKTPERFRINQLPIKGNILTMLRRHDNPVEIYDVFAETYKSNTNFFNFQTKLLCHAIDSQYRALIDLLFEEKCLLNYTEDINSPSPLHRATCMRDKSMIKILLEKKADMNGVDERGITPLCLAVNQGLDIMYLLVENTANPNAASILPIHTLSLFLTGRDYFQVLEILRASGLDIDAHKREMLHKIICDVSNIFLPIASMHKHSSLQNLECAKEIVLEVVNFLLHTGLPVEASSSLHLCIRQFQIWMQFMHFTKTPNICRLEAIVGIMGLILIQKHRNLKRTRCVAKDDFEPMETTIRHICTSASSIYDLAITEILLFYWLVIQYGVLEVDPPRFDIMSWDFNDPSLRYLSFLDVYLLSLSIEKQIGYLRSLKFTLSYTASKSPTLRLRENSIDRATYIKRMSNMETEIEHRLTWNNLYSLKSQARFFILRMFRLRTKDIGKLPIPETLKHYTSPFYVEIKTV